MIRSIKNKARSRRGFTLIELMIVIAILSVILLIMYMLWLSMIRSTRMLDAKVKMRDEARTGMSHMIRNLRMADTDEPGQLLTVDSGGVTVDWSVATPANTVFFDNITFRRPIDADFDGTPFVEGTLDVEWSNLVTFQLDTNDVNGDGRTLQLVQIDSNGNFMRLLVDDISPVVNGGGSGIYDTPGVGGVAFRAIDAKTIEIIIIQRRQLGSGMPTVVSRYEDHVTMRN